MKWFRRTLRESRIFILTLLAVELFYMVDGRNYVNAHLAHEQKEARLKEISELLDIPVEKLRSDHETLFDSLGKLLAGEKDPVKEAGLKRLKEVLKKHEEELAANPYLPQIEAVKREHAVYRIEGIVNDLMQLTEPRYGKALPEASQKAMLRNLHYALQQDLTLPVPEGLPAKAQAKLSAFQSKLDRLFESVRPIIAETQSPDMTGTLAQKIAQLKLAQSVETTRSVREPRFVDRPLPLRRVEKKVRTQEVSSASVTTIPELSPAISPDRASPRIPSKNGIAPEILELADNLGNSPARIFRFVHDSIELDPKWGSFTGSLGTLWARSGTSWDQALLLRDLLVAAGVDARLEWGEVEISTETLVNLAGVSDPIRAGDLLATAGLPIVLLTQGSQVVSARLSHVWVKAHLDYIPNRGATAGSGDTWVRMDPSFTRIDYAPGIRIHDQVPFSLGDYLLSGTELSPLRAYQDALWAYIRANDITCTTLEQLKPAASVRQESFPFVPGTLRGKILSVEGEAISVPAAFTENLEVALRTAAGTPLLTWSASVPATYGQRLEIGWRGATADDQATLDAMGGVFETPPYLVDLVPMVVLDGVEQAAGSAIGSADEVEIAVTLRPANGPADVFVHEGYAGEPGVLATAFGPVPQQVVSRHRETQTAAAAAGDETALETATLQLLGTTYFQNLGRDVADVAGWTWHRLLRLVSEGLVVQTGNVTTTVGGSPLTFTKAETFVDFPGFVVGLFHATGTPGIARPTLELAGAQGSFLEGEVFDQVLEREGIASVSALTFAQREGQTLTLTDGSNVDSVLAGIDLGADVENQVRRAVGAGKVAWLAETPIQVNRWRGTGYVLEDPATGAAAYLISGGWAGGSETGAGTDALQDLLGSEEWLEGSPLGGLFPLLFGFLTGGQGRPGGDGPSTSQSDPINLSTGNLWRTESDFTIQARGLPIVWSRTYNSRSTFDGPLGYGWTFSYGERVEEQVDGSVFYYEADGTVHRFASEGGGYQPPPGKHLTLTRGASEWLLRNPEGLVLRFGVDGRLMEMSEPNGNRVTLGYDGAGNLATVTDAAGRTALTVTTLGGRITEVEDLSGRRVTYTYNGNEPVAVTDTVGETWTYAYDGEHNLIARTDPLGQPDSYAYDRLDRCVRHEDPTGAVEFFSYTSGGRRAALTDRRGFDTYLEMDERGRAILEVDPLGNAQRSTWDPANNRVSITYARGGVTTQTFDERGNTLSETDPLGNTISYTYESTFNQVVTITDPSGHIVTNSYDAAGNLVESSQVISGETLTETMSYDADGLLLSLTDPGGQTTSFSWDATKGVPTSQTDPLGHTTTMTVDALGRVTEIEDPKGNSLTVTWDDRDRLVSATDPMGNTTEIDYDQAGRRIAITTPRGTSTTEYDAAGRPVVSTDYLSNVTRTEYDPAGNPVVRIDARGNRTVTTYDPLNRVAAYVDALGGLWSFGYCAQIGGGGCGGGGCGGGAPQSGDFCELTDPLGNTVKRDFDELGRAHRVTDPEGHSVTIEYNELGRESARVDALGRATRYEYDPLGQLTAVVEGNGARTEYRYDLAGNLTAVVDAEGRTWTRSYDELGRPATKAGPLGNTTNYRYDELGNLIEKTNPDGAVVRYEYDVRRLTAIVLPDGARETFGYDLLGRRISMENAEVSLSFLYDPLNRVTSVTNHTLGQSIQLGYDANGNRITMDGPLGRVRYVFDAKDRLVEQADPATGTYRLDYDAADRRKALHYPNGISTEFEHDRASRLTLLLTRDPQGNTVDGYRYAYDAAGYRTQMQTLRDDVVNEYTYDSAGRLTRWEAGPERFEGYTYDLVGNRLELQNERGTVTYSYDAANRLLEEVRTLTAGGATRTTHDWDPNGNLLSQDVEGGTLTNYTWDALNRLTSVEDASGSHTYGYDPNGIRVRETHGAETTLFLHAGEDIVATYQNDVLDTYFTHGPGVDEPWAQARPGADGVPLAYLHRDGLGSVTAISSPNAQLVGTTAYAAFGAVEATTGLSSRYGFTSRELDATGLMYYRARWYQPEVGRFTGEDPFSGVARRPTTLHAYQYALNNPVSIKDEHGLSPLFNAALLGLSIVFLLISAQLVYFSGVAWNSGDGEIAVFIGALGLAYFVLSFVLARFFFVRLGSAVTTWDTAMLGKLLKFVQSGVNLLYVIPLVICFGAAIGFLVDISYKSDFSLPFDFPRAAIPIIFGLVAELACTFAVFLYGIGTPFFL